MNRCTNPACPQKGKCHGLCARKFLKEARMAKIEEVGVYWHVCEEPTCKFKVEFDDEPFCFTHSPDSGSSVKGYSAREKAEKAGTEIRHKNVFDKK